MNGWRHSVNNRTKLGDKGGWLNEVVHTINYNHSKVFNILLVMPVSRFPVGMNTIKTDLLHETDQISNEF